MCVCVCSILPCDKARQWLSPIEISTTRVVASSSISLGLRAVASEDPQPRHAPQPHAYTWETSTTHTIVHSTNENMWWYASLTFHIRTCPVEVRAREDWLPAHTLRMNIPCRASTTLGLYTRLVSPWPSLPVRQNTETHHTNKLHTTHHHKTLFEIS